MKKEQSHDPHADTKPQPSFDATQKKPDPMSYREEVLPLGVIINEKRVRRFRYRGLKAKDRLFYEQAKGRKIKPIESQIKLLASLILCFVDDDEEGKTYPCTENLAYSMTLKDKTFVQCCVKKISKAKEDISFVCPEVTCGQNVSFEIKFDDIEYSSVDNIGNIEIDGEEKPIVFFERGENRMRAFNKNHGVEVILKIPDHKDMEAILPLLHKGNKVQSDFETYRRCLRKWGSFESENFDIDFVYELDECDFSWLEEVFEENNPGINWRFEVVCPECSTPSVVDLSGQTDFLSKILR